ncbi:MAG: cell wall hydrolase [Alphaproteobacteria bacterium]
MNNNEVLARTIYGEARGEDLEGKKAIACVILNRVRLAKQNKKYVWWGSTIKEVCIKPWQFSCWNENDPNSKKIKAIKESDPTFRDCLIVAENAVNGLLQDTTNGATHYHTKKIMPKWARVKKPCAEIGNHLFYNNIE